MSAATKKKAEQKAEAEQNGRQNGEPTPEQRALMEAIAYEEAIREEAEGIWTDDERGGLDELDSHLFRSLRPLLRKPIPPGFIEHVGSVTGKPYDSTGVRSVQVQMDRLDNVVGPENWGYEATHTEDGKRCYVRAWIGSKDAPLFERDSWGGMNQGSTEGNLWKGSFTNAAKLAFARLGPGWEVYVGAADFDPDTDEEAAKAQGDAPATPSLEVAVIDGDRVAELADAAQAFIAAGDEKAQTRQLVTKLRHVGVTGKIESISRALASLTLAQADDVEAWLEEKGGAS
jgi:hypothetical protein